MKKPLHKHIGHHAKKVHGHLTKYLYERDTIFATLWVFIFIVGLGLIPLNLGIMNPIKLGLKDFDFNDITYSKGKKGIDSSIDTNIVVINIGYADREGIALMIDKVASFKPKVMGLDVMFDGPKDDLAKDSLLRETIRRNDNLVLLGKFQLDTGGKMEITRNFFQHDAKQIGYGNFPAEDLETVRSFYPIKKGEDTTFYSFSATLLKFYDTTAFKKMVEKGDKNVLINYSRRYVDTLKQYFVMEGEQLLMDDPDSSLIEGKIALLAFVNLDPTNIEDKKFTPMNSKFAGKTVPDMNGIFVHANIISMALEHNYVKKVPLWMNILIAIVVCWLHMSFFVRYYLESHIWFHLVAKILQVASSIFFVWLGMYLFDKYRLKVDLKLSLVTIILAVDVIYFYEAWAVWMHKKFHYKTVFKPHHH